MVEFYFYILSYVMESKSLEELEMIFISGKFMEINLPEDKKYLLKYLRTPLQQHVVKYYLTFGGNLKNFLDHTGYACNHWWIRDLRKKIIRLETFKEKARREMDLEMITIIETGKFKKKHWKKKRNN